MMESQRKNLQGTYDLEFSQLYNTRALNLDLESYIRYQQSLALPLLFAAKFPLCRGSHAGLS